MLICTYVITQAAIFYCPDSSLVFIIFNLNYCEFNVISDQVVFYDIYRMIGQLFSQCKNHMKDDYLLLRLLAFLCSEDDINVMMKNVQIHVVALHVADLWDLNTVKIKVIHY